MPLLIKTIMITTFGCDGHAGGDTEVKKKKTHNTHKHIMREL